MKGSVNSVFRSFLDAVVLQQLLEGDTYGYQVCREVEKRSGGAWIIQEGPLYQEFRRMEEEGLIRSYWGDETHGARRRYYALTEAGQKELEKRRAEWATMRETMDDLLRSKKQGGQEDEQGDQ